MPVLVQKTGLLSGSIFAINRFPSVIGRSPSSCDVVLSLEEVSRRHARIEFENGVYFLEDLSGQDRTEVNNRVVISRQPVGNGDVIKLGGIQFEFCVQTRTDHTEMKSGSDSVREPGAEQAGTPGGSVPVTSEDLSHLLMSTSLQSNETFRSILSLMTHGIDYSIAMVSSITGKTCWYKGNLSSQVEVHAIEECITQVVLDSGNPLIVENLPNNEKLCNLQDVAESPFLVSIAAYPYFKDDGSTVEGAMGVATTVPRHFSEAELNRLRKFLPIVTGFFTSFAKFWRQATLPQQLLDDIPLSIWISDQRGDIQWLNRTWLELTGQEVTTGSRRNWRQFVHPDDIATVVRFLDSNWKTETGQTVEFRLIKENGSCRWMEGRCNPRLDQNGNINGLIGTWVDITDDLATADQLERLEAEQKRVAMKKPHFAKFKDQARNDASQINLGESEL